MYRCFLKRGLDLIIAMLALPFFLILGLIVGPLIYFEDKGTIFYKAPRLGKGGKIFSMYKFRSMKMVAPDLRNEDGSTYNAGDDPRLTKIGRFMRQTSIDETPQLFNILKNDMSIIGPRPDLPEHFSTYEEDEKRKLEVLPGVTGYNQAYFRNSVNWKARLKNDVYYVDHLSFWLDVKVFFKSIQRIVLKKGIYMSDKKSKSGEK